MGRLDERVAIVTGAGRGIGAAVAQRLAAEGAHVVVTDIGVGLDGSGGDTTPADDVVANITESGGIAASYAADVSSHAAGEQLVQFAIDTFGRLDILINAAGILRDRMVFNMSEDEWDSVIAVHLKGCFNTTRFASAYWRKEPGEDRRLINFTSIAGLNGSPSQPNYAAAKMGIIGFTMSCANALGKYGVTANCVSPGAATRMTQAIPAELLAEYRKTQDLPDDFEQRRSPDSMTPALVYLASKDSGWLTGRVIGAQEYRISLWNVPEIQRQIVSAGPWDLDDVFRELPGAFRAPVEGRKRLDEA
ncbi:MAG TPA: SDR family NAD(P)-dependent oxidoreductase [Ilumatobacter sp.]|nr:SDR family NAD(P)-dependent oxidoreductase [Ilumatobacter sp.]